MVQTLTKIKEIIKIWTKPRKTIKTLFVCLFILIKKRVIF